MASRDNATIEHGALVRQWKWPLRIGFWWLTIGLCVWLFALAVHAYWAHRFGAGEPVRHAQQVVQAELGTLSHLRPLVFEPIAAATWLSTSIHDAAVTAALWSSRALMNWPITMRTNAASATQRVPGDPGGDFVHRQLREAGDTWLLLVAATQIFATRTATYLCALPLLALGLVLGIADGLVARAKRKACAGHESASLYHRAKLGLSFVAILGYLAFMALPSVPRPEMVLVPLAVALSLLIRLQCKFYKKYL